jgi:hypothetical protein
LVASATFSHIFDDQGGSLFNPPFTAHTSSADTGVVAGTDGAVKRRKTMVRITAGSFESR